MCSLIPILDLPLNFAESPAFEEYIRLSHNPVFKKVFRQTTSRDFVKFFTDRRTKVVECLQSITSIAITSDICCGNAKEDYLSVVAHYVSKDWLLEKRVIGLRLIETSHTGENIVERVMIVLEDYGVVNKVFSITLDNASSNSKAMEKLSPLLSGYVGTLFLHQRCACHIINLIVKCGLKRLNHYLDSFRTAIIFLNASDERIAAFKGYCVAMNVRPRKFGIDMAVRWNSTYLILKHLVPYKKTFVVFMDTNYPRKPGDPNLLTNSHWYVAEKLLEFLELFYDATMTLSGFTILHLHL
jgi:NADPH-dependent 7-cyano-7-deazaguanine reductase QueF